uniref:Uncharacterized protein n=1 Tax=Anguilla anguilla TaxID=7936 RepID=A0A0E9PNU2_ANGAN
MVTRLAGSNPMDLDLINFKYQFK